jgi:hypothetical protein
MLASGQRIFCHLIMRGIRGADVDRVDRCVLEQLAIIVDHGFHTKPRAKPFCRGEFPASDRGQVNELYSPQRLQMHAAHKSGSDYCGSKETLHKFCDVGVND